MFKHFNINVRNKLEIKQDLVFNREGEKNIHE